jgi:hypothetical protein
MKPVWQVGGGKSRNPYDEILVKYGVALIGPGDAGKWTPQRGDTDFDGNWVRRFATEPQIGDVILLRIGCDRIVAIGLVASDYEYLEQFDDVHGWDLQHGRRVRWRVLPTPQVFPTRVFGANPPRFSGVYSDIVVQFANEVMSVGVDDWKRAPLPLLPLQEKNWENPPEFLNKLVGLAQDWARMIWSSCHSFEGWAGHKSYLQSSGTTSTWQCFKLSHEILRTVFVLSKPNDSELVLRAH